MNQVNTIRHDAKPVNFSYIVIGGGIAGVTCAEHLNILHDDGSILLITASEIVKTVTNIQHVTKTLDVFDVEEKTSDSIFQNSPSITAINSAVVSLDGTKQLVYTGSNVYHYEKLCICTGAKPKIIFPENPFVLWIRDTESVKQFQKRIGIAKRIVIVGNGGIATEMVYEISGVEVIWAIKDKSINAVFIDPGAAEFIIPNLENEKVNDKYVKRWKYSVEDSQHEQCNIHNYLGGALGPDWHSGLDLKGHTHRKVVIETEVEVTRLLSTAEHSQNGWPVYVELSNGKTYGCDFIVSATGVTPNLDALLNGNTFKLGDDGGLLVSDKMETSVKNIYAAGDVCTAGWNYSQHWFQLRLWTQARQMGSYAAKCMWASLIREEIYMDFCFEMFSHSTKFFGHKVVLLGLYNGQKLGNTYEILLRMTKGKEYIKCVMADGRMQGAILIGDTGLEETFENLILNQMDLTPYGEDLLDPNIDIEDYFD